MGEGFLASIPILGKLFDDAGEIAKEAVVDKDKRDALIGKLDELKKQFDRELHLAELRVKTLPWVDALHKMGRQILNIISIISVVVLSLCNIEITPTMALVLGGGNVAYQIIKGRGK
jgi:hypothetical protein